MEKDYQTKDLKAAKPKPKKDGDIYKDGKLFKFITNQKINFFVLQVRDYYKYQSKILHSYPN